MRKFWKPKPKYDLSPSKRAQGAVGDTTATRLAPKSLTAYRSRIRNCWPRVAPAAWLVTRLRR